MENELLGLVMNIMAVLRVGITTKCAQILAHKDALVLKNMCKVLSLHCMYDSGFLTVTDCLQICANILFGQVLPVEFFKQGIESDKIWNLLTLNNEFSSQDTGKRG